MVRPQASSTHVVAVSESFSDRGSIPRASIAEKQVGEVLEDGEGWGRMVEVAPVLPPPSSPNLHNLPNLLFSNGGAGNRTPVRE